MSASKSRFNRIICGVVLAALGIIGLSAREQTAASDGSPVSLRVYVGTYTGTSSRGIYRLDFDQTTGKWTSGPVLAANAENPSFLALHPSGRYLYAVNELKVFEGRRTGSVSAFAVDAATGALTFVNARPSEGADPCHLVVDPSGGYLLVANYTGGTVAVLPISSRGGLEAASDVRRWSGSGPNKTRQEGPHAHAVLFDPEGQLVSAADLGTDRVVPYQLDRSSGRLRPATPDARMPQGAGPRHLAWHPSGRALYVLNELTSSVSVLLNDSTNHALQLKETVPARAAGATGDNTGAEIAVSPDGRYLYASNRGDDNIAVFAIDRARLTIQSIGHVSTGGRTPRSFAIDPTGRWLVAANQQSDSLIVFRLDATGLPVRMGEPVSVPEPVCVLFAGAAR